MHYCSVKMAGVSPLFHAHRFMGSGGMCVCTTLPWLNLNDCSITRTQDKYSVEPTFSFDFAFRFKQDWMTSLYIAAGQGHNNVVKTLLAANAEHSATDNVHLVSLWRSCFVRCCSLRNSYDPSHLRDIEIEVHRSISSFLLERLRGLGTWASLWTLGRRSMTLSITWNRSHTHWSNIVLSDFALCIAGWSDLALRCCWARPHWRRENSSL